MTKKRMIHDCIWKSEGMSGFTIRQRLLWIGLITTADDQGRGRAHPGLVRASIFPFDQITLDDITADLQAIADTGMLILYEDDGKRLYQVVNWWEYQSPAWVSASDYPPPEGWADRWRYHGPNREIMKSDNWSEDSGLPIGLRKQLPRRLPTPQEEVEEEEEEEVKDISSSASADLQAILSEWAIRFPNKPQPRPTTKTLQRQARTRMKSKDFRDDWLFALTRAQRSKFCNEGGWFDLYWFLKNDDNWRKCLAGNYDDKNNGKPPTPQYAEVVPEGQYQDPDDFFRMPEVKK